MNQSCLTRRRRSTNPQHNGSHLVCFSLRRTKGEDGDEKQKEELERVKTIVRKVRSDPPIAPDEPVPVVVRPYDVDPGDTTSDIHFVYKHALTTVHDVLRQMAVRPKRARS